MAKLSEDDLLQSYSALLDYFEEAVESVGKLGRTLKKVHDEMPPELRMRMVELKLKEKKNG